MAVFGVRIAPGWLLFWVMAAVFAATAWVSWGFYGWAVIMGLVALVLFSRALGGFRDDGTRTSSESDPAKDVVGLTYVRSRIEAELICQTLEGEGIPATYYGRANTPSGVIPGGGVIADGGPATRGVRVGVRRGDVEHANEILDQVQQESRQLSQPDCDNDA